MKKIYILLLLLAASATVSFAENYFRLGTEWVVYNEPEPDAPISPFVNYYSLREADDGSGDLIMMEDNSDQLYIKTDGDKVYSALLNSEPNPERDWYLLYDFGLQPGEGDDFYYNDTFGLWRTFYSCEKISDSNPYFDGWPTMKMKEELDYTSWIDDYPLILGYWIIGLGDQRGPLYTLSWEWIPGGGKLIEVKDNGELIYSNYPASVKSITDYANLDIRLDGLNLSIDSGTELRGAVYNIDGTVVGEFRGNTMVQLPSAGIFIVKAGEFSRKIMAKP